MKNTMNFKPAAVSVLLGMSTMMAMGAAQASDAPTSLNQDAVSLLQAVEIAKNETGAVALEAERDMKKGQAVYEIELASADGQELKTIIDAQTGDVILTKKRRNHDHDDHDDQVENAMWVSGLKNNTYVSLEQAVAQAEAEFGGKAWSVDVDDHWGDITYEVELLDANGKRVETHIDAMVQAAK
ncbi:PepSY domain-containing protein [Enterovibrio calviensis]|uniref:PepSY domain-containing protein n=1 Tax=Enterovibrio calviensis TaxID=91359 RepID=UPI00048A3F2A|nr:PepSY domain-containing protein [Enterovibrio calviensis]